MTVPQTKELEVWNWYGVALVPVASMARLAYVDVAWVIVTPAVAVVRVAEIAVSSPQPAFLSGTLSLMHSSRLTTPLLLRFAASLIVRPLVWMFEVPVMQKFCDVVPPDVAMTETVAGEPLVQLRSVSAALAVYVPAGTRME